MSYLSLLSFDSFSSYSSVYSSRCCRGIPSHWTIFACSDGFYYLVNDNDLEEFFDEVSFFGLEVI